MTKKTCNCGNGCLFKEGIVCPEADPDQETIDLDESDREADAEMAELSGLEEPARTLICSKNRIDQQTGFKILSLLF